MSANDTLKGTERRVKNGWLVKYGLRVSERDRSTGEIIGLACQFCEIFEREERSQQEQRKRKRTNNIKFFQQPWRCDHIAYHMQQQHSDKYREYCSLALDEKTSFFPAHIEKNSRGLKSFGISTKGKLVYEIHGDIVHVIIGDLLLEPDFLEADFDNVEADEEAEPEDEIRCSEKLKRKREKALQIFKLKQHARKDVETDFAIEGDEFLMFDGLEDCDVNVIFSEEASGSSAADANALTSMHEVFVVEVQNPTLFNLIVGNVSKAMTFRMCVENLTMVKEETGLSSIGNVNMDIVISTVRIVCALNFQMLRDILEKTWAFSIAFDGGDKSDTSYLDIRLRFAWRTDLKNVHLCAIPMYESHTGEYMAGLIKKFLVAICPNWQKKLIGIASDGTSSMTGRFKGAVTRLENLSSFSLYRVWCGAHQLDLVIQAALKLLLNKRFIALTTAVTKHLRKQKNLVLSMRSKCPRFVETRWLSMGRLLVWLVLKRVTLQKYFADKQPDCSPPIEWWIVVLSLSPIIALVNKTCRRLQGKTTTVGDQRICFTELHAKLCTLAKIANGEIQQANQQDAAFSCACVWTRGQYIVRMKNVIDFIQDQGIYSMKTLEALKQEASVDNGSNFAEPSADSSAYYNTLVSLGQFLVNIAHGVSVLVAERGSDNAPATDDEMLPPLLPHSIATLPPREFAKILLRHEQRLLATFQEEEPTTKLEREFHSLREDQGILSGTDEVFQRAWAPLQNKYPLLIRFFGGLASVFAGSSTVESDFSIIGYEKDPFRSCLSNFSLEGIMQCKEHKQLSKLFRATQTTKAV